MSALALAEAPAASEGEPGRRLVFLIEGAEADDALMRVLGTCSVQQVRLTDLRFAAEGGRMSMRLEVEAFDEQRAEHLRRRLGQIPAISSVSLGWRALRTAA